MSNTPFDFIAPEHFVSLNTPEIQRSIFAQSITMVEVEVFSYCNRQCWFCPNSYIDRQTTKIYMPEELYLKVLKELAEIRYSNQISFSRYNEPMADKIILTRLRQARELLPTAYLHMNTNGDYVTPEYLDELRQSGLDSLHIQCYLADDMVYKDDDVKQRVRAVSNNMQLPIKSEKQCQQESYSVVLEYPKLQLRVTARNFAHNGCNRGALINVGKELVRSSPCLSPFHHLYIDYNGMVVPCCNIRSDAPEHANYVVGDIAQQSIYQIYTGDALLNWRRQLFQFCEVKSPPPCKSCTFSMHEPTEDNVARTSTLVNYLDQQYAYAEIIENLRKALSAGENECEKMRTALCDSQRRLTEFQCQLDESQRHANELNDKLEKMTQRCQTTQQQLIAIQQSRAWKAILRYRKVVNKVRGKS